MLKRNSSLNSRQRQSAGRVAIGAAGDQDTAVTRNDVATNPQWPPHVAAVLGALGAIGMG
jgi:hypothetical protein